MKYREFGKTGIKVSSLGFGCMRFPLVEGSDVEVDVDKSISLIRHGIDKGINYIDTAYPYHNGKSEIITGQALSDGYREKVYLATKLPSWLIKSRADMDRYLEEQLEKLQTEYIDFYLLHTLNTAYWKILLENNVFEFLEEAKAAGKIRHIGFSFHDELPLFKEIVDAYEWDFCQIQYNFMDVDYQAGLEGLDYAASKGMGVVIMEPLRGGSIVSNIPNDIQDLWNSSSSITTPADAALRYIWDHGGVGTILSGMNSLQQVDENISSSDKGEAGGFTDEERTILTEVRSRYEARIIANCTNCRYCMPCPSGVDIPANLSYLNNQAVYGNLAPFRNSYNNYFNDNKKAHHCIECGQCEEACPQNISIMDCLRQVVEIMS
jgi:hypothetical protein